MREQIIAKMRKIEIITDHNKHTHTQRANSHWHLRFSHWPLTQHSLLTPLAIPNNDKYQEFNMQGLKNG